MRATIIPSIAVPLSLVGTFGGMYLLGYSLDNLSLMALAISTGFVVDDAIVVLENIMRHVEHGMSVVKAAFQGAAEIGFTVLSMSVSLVAVFIPLLMMGGIVGRLFREFAVTLSMAIGISLVISLTTTPTMCAKFLRPAKSEKHNRFYRASEWIFERLLATYTRALKWVLCVPTGDADGHHPGGVPQRVSLHHCPQGIFPAAGHGTHHGRGDGFAGHFLPVDEPEDAAISRHRDERSRGGIGGGLCGRNTAQNQGRFFMMLKPLQKRGPCEKQHFWQSCHYVTADDVINRLRGKLAVVPGATLILQSAQDLTIGGRHGNAAISIHFAECESR